MDGEGAAFVVVVEFHLGGVVGRLAVDEVADGGVFYNHARPEGVPGEAEEIRTSVGEDFNDNISPAGEDVGGLFDFVVRKGRSDNLVEGIFGREILIHVV